MILVLAALGLRSALLVGLAIPTSFMVGFLILGGIGHTVNNMVMFGLVLTVGLLVDGAIVMTEYADRKVHEGMEDREAYIRAAKLMFWPIVSSTATTLVAFLPMLLWPGVAGEFMSYLPIMVIIVLTASLFTAMVFLPVTGGIFAQVSHWMERHAACPAGRDNDGGALRSASSGPLVPLVNGGKPACRTDRSTAEVPAIGSLLSSWSARGPTSSCGRSCAGQQARAAKRANRTSAKPRSAFRQRAISTSRRSKASPASMSGS
jgi:multidrug efflux pump